MYNFGVVPVKNGGGGEKENLNIILAHIFYN